ncbi:MAG: NADH-quinone oxidoreductase subunit B family protein [bacterium]|nr:NADH-quinone oxidoreductase subunit B family protein [bacterium]MCX7917175.1 NADH-quinone oxidoreductase subunit B family protein [bacterium]MDW8164471.1 NADH-quinone oxidoreductase subunit B family protein [Candidatus Omnitrophota bacterium]
MNLKLKALKKSLWVYHVSAGSCNNCDIEILDLLTPRFDVERFGIVLVGSPRHADVLLCTGIVNKKCVERVKEVYEQTPKPCVVVAIGACACSGGIFRDGYQMAGPLNKIIPVDVYIPGCPPKPEAIIAGIVKFLKEIK